MFSTNLLAAPSGIVGFFWGPFALIARYREILVRTVVTEVRRKYAGSVMGMLWMAAFPLILMSLYALIYLAIFRIQPAAMTQFDYVLYIFSGLIPFLGFMEALNTGASSLSLNRAVLLNTVFPSELIPVRAVLAAQGATFVGLTIILVLAIGLGKHSLVLLLVPFLWLLLVLFVTGLAWVLSLASLVLRDIQQILAFVSIVLLIISPIAYTLDMAPGPIRVVVYGNPLSYFLIALHEVLVFGRLPPAGVLATTVCIALSSFCLGFWTFQRAKRLFFDYA